jgi:hypothetical protein
MVVPVEGVSRGKGAEVRTASEGLGNIISMEAQTKQSPHCIGRIDVRG